MEEALRYLTDGLVDLATAANGVLGSALETAPWKLAMVLVLGMAGIVLVSALPEDQRSGARAIVLVAFGLSALVAIFAPIDWKSLLG